MTKYILNQTAIGDYRQEVISILQEDLGDDLEICVGDVYFDGTTKTRINFSKKPYELKNIFLFNKRVLFQYGSLYRSIFCKNVILEMNPRIINTWLVAIFRRLLFKPVVMWGHAWPRQGKDSPTDSLRSKLRSLATIIIVYTETQKYELLEKEPDLQIIVAPNSLYNKDQMYVENNVDKCDFIYVGRLVESKKIVLLIRSFISFQIENGFPKSVLKVVGEGEQRSICEAIISDLPKEQRDIMVSRILFFGHVSDINLLRELYSSCIASISPGYVGLSITQSFAFGVPMIISRQENHSPEIEAAIIGANAIFFETDNILELSNKIKSFFYGNEKLKYSNKDIIDECKSRYSADIMAERLSLALKLEVDYSPDNRLGSFKCFIRGLVRFFRKSIIKFKSGRRFKSGRNVYFGRLTTISSPDFCDFSNNISIGERFFVQTNLSVASDCLISSNVSFVGNDHSFNIDGGNAYWSGKNDPSVVILEGDNFIGYGATIVGNVTIGRGAVVAAGSVVVNDVPENTIVGGCPARFIKRRY
jgi:acetyltransferase-like isoleucine patch superfamily enzyme/glycosyltransferase involved in cell wall biosynthesis